jgi:hypothetical protein
MVRLVVTAVIAFLAAGGAAACPLVTSKTGAVQVSTRDLTTPRSAEVRAGGTVVLDACAEVPGTGHVPFEPSAVLDFNVDLRGRALALRTAGACDAVLLVRTARGHWHFDDDSAGRGQAQLVLANPASGRYRVWVGSYDAFGCDAELVIGLVRVRGR